jgi:hypothetical protein
LGAFAAFHAANRAFRSNLLAAPKGFPLQSLAHGRQTVLPKYAYKIASQFFRSAFTALKQIATSPLRGCGSEPIIAGIAFGNSRSQTGGARFAAFS